MNVHAKPFCPTIGPDKCTLQEMTLPLHQKSKTVSGQDSERNWDRPTHTVPASEMQNQSTDKQQCSPERSPRQESGNYKNSQSTHIHNSSTQNQAHLKVSTLNAHSLRPEAKRKDILATLTSGSDLTVITETWMNFALKWKHPDLKILQSPLNPYHGVLIATAQLESNLQPILPDAWTDGLVAARFHRKVKHEAELMCFIVAVYWPPTKFKEYLPRTEAIIYHCRRLSPDLPIIVTGDLNLTRKKITVIEDKLGLKLAQTQDILPTHLSPSAKRHTQTDYTLVSQGSFESECTQEERWSDHNVLKTSWYIHAITEKSKQHEFQHVLKKLTVEQEQQILTHKDWPTKSYIEVAKQLGLTVKIKKVKELDAGLNFIEKKRKKELDNALQQTKEIMERYHDMNSKKQALTQETLYKKLMQIWKQKVPKMFLRFSQEPGSILSKRILESIRVTCPKEFFQAIHTLMRSKSRAHIATKFRVTVEGNVIQEPIEVHEYIKDLYKHGQVVEFSPIIGPIQRKHVITKQEVRAAISALGNKATGVDALSAKSFKRKEHRKTLVRKLCATFNKWSYPGSIPPYVVTGKLLNLSKDNTQYPAVGQIRTISMGCGIFKVFESVVLSKLKPQIQKLGLIHQNQRGFQENKCTAQNINELLKVMIKAKQIQQQYRVKKVPVGHRQNQFILFVDLKKAFDSVDRSKLLQSLVEKNIDQETVNSLATLLVETQLDVVGKTVNNSIGVPQGSRLSPILFVLYIDNLVKKLNEGGRTCLAFADDLVVHAPTPQDLSIACNDLQEWSKQTGIEVNQQKSAILQIRVDHRTPAPKVKKLNGIPFVKEYKYLGLVITDSLNFRTHDKKLITILDQYRKAMWNKNVKRLPASINYHSWITLVHSRIQYATFLASQYSRQIKEQYKRFLASSAKILLNLKGNISHEKLVEATTGLTGDQIVKQEEEAINALIQGKKQGQWVKQAETESYKNTQLEPLRPWFSSISRQSLVSELLSSIIKQRYFELNIQNSAIFRGQRYYTLNNPENSRIGDIKMENFQKRFRLPSRINKHPLYWIRRLDWKIIDGEKVPADQLRGCYNLVKPRGSGASPDMQCKLCHYQFANKTILMRHVIAAHWNHPKRTVFKGKNDKYWCFACPGDGQSFAYSQQLQKHLRNPKAHTDETLMKAGYMPWLWLKNNEHVRAKKIHKYLVNKNFLLADGEESVEISSQDTEMEDEGSKQPKRRATRNTIKNKGLKEKWRELKYGKKTGKKSKPISNK